MFILVLGSFCHKNDIMLSLIYHLTLSKIPSTANFVNLFFPRVLGTEKEKKNEYF